jgi:hypothetical protein
MSDARTITSDSASDPFAGITADTYEIIVTFDRRTTVFCGRGSSRT